MNTTNSFSPVIRGTGVTASERYLASLCEKTFLRLWSYPNTFIDRGRKTARDDGKELCDLLVVCGDDILIFSDKTIAWPPDCQTEVAWKRWFKRAIKKSADQVRGAERWINEFSDRIYLDRKCTKPLPIELPPPERRRIHGIVIALGAGNACKDFFAESTGSLMVIPEITGDDILKGGHSLPFTIGDLNPAGSFIHVLDDATLDTALSELDTISDFSSYLRSKEEFVRSGKLVSATGEEDLLAYYATHMNEKGKHDFVHNDGKPFEADMRVIIDSCFEGLKKDSRYIAKKQANEVSYVWDFMIDLFARNLMDGTSVVPDGPISLSDGEKCIRHMALLDRFQRRLLGSSIREAVMKGASQPRFTRCILSQRGDKSDDTAFFFMMLAVPDISLKNGYEQYRRVRCRMMETYALSIMQKHPNLRRVVGIATEPPTNNGSSQDLILVEDPVWSRRLLEELEALRERYGIMVDQNLEFSHMHAEEYPDIINNKRKKPKT